jgi:hypothetical protein
VVIKNQLQLTLAMWKKLPKSQAGERQGVHFHEQRRSLRGPNCS